MSFVQITLKFRMNAAHGVVPANIADLTRYVGAFLRDPWLYIAVLCFLGAAFLWYFALSRLPLNVTFAFTALSYPIVFFMSWLVFRESVTLPVVLGHGAIISGIFLIGWGNA